MLNRVPEAMRVANRAMVTRHQNSIDGQLYRRELTRTFGTEAGNVGEIPTLGGLTVMERGDEAEFDYTLLGDCKVLFITEYEGTEFTNNLDSPESMAVGMALIEPVVAGAFQPILKDLVMLMPGGGVVIPYQVTNMLSQVNVPPYVPKFELSQQGDINFVEAVRASQAEREA